MWDLETIRLINAEGGRVRAKNHPLRHHPRIVELRIFLRKLQVNVELRARLYGSLWKYADQIVSRPVYRPEEGWDDFEALQQVTLGDWMEETIQSRCHQTTLPNGMKGE